MHTDTKTNVRLVADCQAPGCNKVHEAEYSHEGLFDEGPIYAVVCWDDGLTNYHTTEGVYPHPDGPRPNASTMGIVLDESPR